MPLRVNGHGIVNCVLVTQYRHECHLATCGPYACRAMLLRLAWVNSLLIGSLSDPVTDSVNNAINTAILYPLLSSIPFIRIAGFTINKFAAEVSTTILIFMVFLQRGHRTSIISAHSSLQNIPTASAQFSQQHICVCYVQP
jgi:hypothetical protein